MVQLKPDPILFICAELPLSLSLARFDEKLQTIKVDLLRLVERSSPVIRASRKQLKSIEDSYQKTKEVLK